MTVGDVVEMEKEITNLSPEEIIAELRKGLQQSILGTANTVQKYELRKIEITEKVNQVVKAAHPKLRAVEDKDYSAVGYNQGHQDGMKVTIAKGTIG
jgi:hypothetical protein